MSPRSLSTFTPSTSCTSSRSGSVPFASEALPARTATPRTSSVSSSLITSSLWPSKRREADLRPWRISGSATEMTRSLATPCRICGEPSSPFDVLGDDLIEQGEGLGERGILERSSLGGHRLGGDDEQGEVGAAAGSVLPVDVGLVADVGPRGSDRRGREAVAGAGNEFCEKAAHEVVGVTDRPGPVHRRGVDDRGELA